MFIVTSESALNSIDNGVAIHEDICPKEILIQSLNTIPESDSHKIENADSDSEEDEIKLINEDIAISSLYELEKLLMNMKNVIEEKGFRLLEHIRQKLIDHFKYGLKQTDIRTYFRKV